MISLEELVEQRKELNRKKYELLLYLMESRKIQGDISQITYRQNSGIDDDYGQVQVKNRLKAALRQMDDGLKQRYHLSPRMVQYEIDRCGDELKKIDKQIETIEQQGRVAAPQGQPDVCLRDTPERLCPEGGENRVREGSAPTPQASQDSSGSFPRGVLPCRTRVSGLAGQLARLAQQFSERPQPEPGRDYDPDPDR